MEVLVNEPTPININTLLTNCNMEPHLYSTEIVDNELSVSFLQSETVIYIYFNYCTSFIGALVINYLAQIWYITFSNNCRLFNLYNCIAQLV